MSPRTSEHVLLLCTRTFEAIGWIAPTRGPFEGEDAFAIAECFGPDVEEEDHSYVGPHLGSFGTSDDAGAFLAARASASVDLDHLSDFAGSGP